MQSTSYLEALFSFSPGSQRTLAQGYMSSVIGSNLTIILRQAGQLLCFILLEAFDMDLCLLLPASRRLVWHSLTHICLAVCII